MEADEVVKTRRCGFHQGQGAVFPHQQVGYMSAAYPPRAENLSSSQAAYTGSSAAAAKAQALTGLTSNLASPRTPFGDQQPGQPEQVFRLQQGLAALGSVLPCTVMQYFRPVMSGEYLCRAGSPRDRILKKAGRAACWELRDEVPALMGNRDNSP